MQPERHAFSGMVAFDILRSGLERLAGDMVLGLAEVDPDAFLLRVLHRADAIAALCSYCRTVYGLKDGCGTTGFSHGICFDCFARVGGRAVNG